MKINNGISIFMGEASRSQRSQELEQQNNGEKRNTIFAGDWNQTQDSILLKRQEAQKKALKVVSDAWEADKKIDDDLKKRQEHIDRLNLEISALDKEVQDIEARKEELKEQYGLGEEGLSQEDKKLLDKEAMLPAGLTEQERDRYKELEAQGITEYYDRCKELDSFGDTYRSQIEENRKVIREENAIMEGIHKQRLDLRNHPMIKAQKQAEAIKEAAGKEIMGMLVDEAKEHIDEEQAEREEQAQEVEEKKEEEEALLAKRKEESEKAEKQAEALAESMPTQELLQLEDIKTDIQKEVQDIVDKMKLVEEDIKGSMVDKTI